MIHMSSVTTIDISPNSIREHLELYVTSYFIYPTIYLFANKLILIPSIVDRVITDFNPWLVTFKIIEEYFNYMAENYS